MLRTISRFVLAFVFMIAGTTHLLTPTPYLAIMPPYIRWPGAVVVLSGIAEILGAAGICFRATRAAAGWGLIVLLIAVFPANIQALSTGMVVGGHAVPTWALWARLPFQALFIAWTYLACLSSDAERLQGG
jgi:uncharacterized membrane protein